MMLGKTLLVIGLLSLVPVLTAINYPDEDDDILENVDDLLDEWNEEMELDGVLEGGFRLQKRYVRDYLDPYDWYRGDEFKRRYRFTKEIVRHYIVELIRDELDHADRRGLPVPPELAVVMALRFLATGDIQQVIGDLRGFSQSTACRCINNVCRALAHLLHSFVKFPSTTREQLVNIQLFYNIAGFPGVAAAIDGTHIPIICPSREFGEIFRNRKGYFSLNILVAVDAKGRILFIDVRHPGSAHDATCFDRSALKVMFQEHWVEGLLIGDNGYGNYPYLLVPYVIRDTEEKVVYSECQIATRNPVERFFGRWKKMFACLKRGLRNYIDNTISIICAAAVLWNIHMDFNYPNDYDIQNLIVEEEALAIPPLPGMSGLAYREAFVREHFNL
ncbi:hypothetical protein QAD02_013609 [Eretmocerus hayati]|uniref:Uncharacterized protein n=1 Tax=Eretmocerus hayati TaxID=131215 RepID=A0ACC2P371_9HYME|nr:hypothetical protein QAD02_013609 [Eretmocerus hayati]